MCAETPHPEKIGRFQIAETLAQGDSWQTFRGIDPATNLSVTLKTVTKNRLEADGASGLAEFQSEARAAAALNHPGIVKVLEYGEDAGIAFIATEYVDGISLPPGLHVPLPDAVSLGVQLLAALDYAHDQGVAHHDLKPANLVVTKDGKLHIAGFGVARFTAGTPQFMSPEQFGGLPVDRRSDVFSAGIIFYELLTGVSPFAGPPQGLLDRVCHEKEKPPSAIDPNVPTNFDAVCAKALAKAVYDRYPTAFSFSSGIQTAFGFPVSPAVSKNALAAIAPQGFGDKKSGNSSHELEALQVAHDFKWDPDVLSDVQHLLAAFVGPMARVIIKEAASRTTDLDRLYVLASESLQKPEERKAFLSKSPSAANQKGQPARPPSGVRPAAIPNAAKPPGPPAAPPVRQSSPAVPVKPVTPPPVPKPDVKPSAPRPKVAPEISLPFLAQPETLAGYMKDNPPQLEEVVYPFVATVQALLDMYAANNKGAALSPENVFFDRAGKATIRTSATPSDQGSGSGIILTSPRYAAPEIFADKGGAQSSTAHVYALGMMFYEILLGKLMFQKTFPEQRSDLDWLRWHGDLEKRATPLKMLLPSCPAAMSDLVEEMMEKNAEKRPPDPQAVMAKLRPVAQRANRTVILNVRKPAAAPVAPAPVAAEPKPAKKVKVKGEETPVIIWILILAVACLLGFLIWKNQERLWELIEPYYHRLVGFDVRTFPYNPA
ncbi:MAG TPA: protein kinase [Terriglobales bacterium]|jgi:serine/threonine-protein kinase|nr:protein kinase [Terriglobales bacterium]